MSTALTAADQSVQTITVKFQVFTDDTNLDAYKGSEVWTRSSILEYQKWKLTLVDRSPDGIGIYTIESTKYTLKFLTALARGEVKLEESRGPDALSQRWEVNLAQKKTPIVSIKFGDAIIQANGKDKAVTLIDEVDVPQANQLWTITKVL